MIRKEVFCRETTDSGIKFVTTVTVVLEVAGASCGNVEIMGYSVGKRGAVSYGIPSFTPQEWADITTRVREAREEYEFNRLNQHV